MSMLLLTSPTFKIQDFIVICMITKAVRNTELSSSIIKITRATLKRDKNKLDKEKWSKCVSSDVIWLFDCWCIFGRQRALLSPRLLSVLMSLEGWN